MGGVEKELFRWPNVRKVAERGGTNSNSDLTIMVWMVWGFTYKSLTITV